MVPQAAGAPGPGSGGTAQTNPLVPQPPGSRGSKLSFQQNAQQPAVANRSIPIRNLAEPPRKKKSPVVKLAIWGVVLIGLGAGVYFAWPLVGKVQKHFAAKEADAGTNSSSGPDATNSSNPRSGNASGRAGVAGANPAPANGAAPGAPGAAAGPGALNRPVYTLDVTTAKIPDGPVNGMISGGEFVPDLMRIETVGAAQVLRLTQGSPTTPDREILVYLHLRPGDKLSGHTLTIAEDQKGGDVPQVIKRWTPKPGFAPQYKAFPTGYAMKLELGQLANGALPGKIYIALPDAEQSVVGGAFSATTSLQDVITAVTPTPGVTPAPTPASVPIRPRGEATPFDKRYGGKR